MTQKYILTGGPGSGKSSILLELELRGEYTIRECAEDTIKRAQADGVEKPWEQADFQDRILALQVQREKRVPAGLERAFLDRGVPDGEVYVKLESETYRRIKEQTPRYAGIFLIENLGQTQTNRVRREDQTAALEIERKLEGIYESQGYRVQRIGPGTVKERTEKILGVINSREELR